jgi:hypothetical protein
MGLERQGAAPNSDYAKRERVNVLGLHETIRADFSTADLRSLEFGGPFVWNWVSANGHSGGMLLGFRDECFEVGEWRKGSFFLSATIFQRKGQIKWCFMLIYSPADHRRTYEFLGELEREVLACQLPIVVGGRFQPY